MKLALNGNKSAGLNDIATELYKFGIEKLDFFFHQIIDHQQ